MTRGKGGGEFQPDVLMALSAERRYDKQLGPTNYGRWDQRRTDAYVRKLRRTLHRKHMAKLNARPKKRARPIPTDPTSLSIAERVLLHMVPGEWLASTDIADRSGIPRRHVSIKLIQIHMPRGAVVRIRNPDARSPMEQSYGKGIRNPQWLYALTAFGCAMRASRVDLADFLGAPITTPESDWKIPEKFLQSFGIDFSPFFPGRRRPMAKLAEPAQRAALAQWRAAVADRRATDANPWDVCGRAAEPQEGAASGRTTVGSCDDT